MEPDKHEIVQLENMAVLGVFGMVTCGGDVSELWEPAFTRRMKEITKLATIRNRCFGVTYDGKEELLIPFRTKGQNR